MIDDLIYPVSEIALIFEMKSPMIIPRLRAAGIEIKKLYSANDIFKLIKYLYGDQSEKSAKQEYEKTGNIFL